MGIADNPRPDLVAAAGAAAAQPATRRDRAARRGREWQIDYYKHPPLPAWILEAIAIVSGRGPPALYLAGPLASAASLFAVWRLGCVMIGERRAMLAVLAQTGVVYFTIFMPEFNHYVILLPLWVQIDGSEQRLVRGPWSCVQSTLLAFVDDATSRLMALRFVASELAFDYFRTTRAYL